MPTAPGTPTVSVVLPTYNRAHLLPRAIQSVLDQTWSDFELIVVDDGSSDDTPSVMASFTDPRIRYVRYELNQGANHARNVGIREARAEFIAFQDSDDDWFPDKLAKNMAAFETAGPEIGVVYSGYWQDIDAADHRIYIPLPWVKTRDGWIHDELLRNNFVATPTAVVRRECFDRSGYWLESLPGKQEWELFLRISRDYQFRYIDEPLLNSRFTPSGISNDRLGIYQSMEQILEIHIDDFGAHPDVLAEHYVRLGLQYARAGEFEKGRDYLQRGAALCPANWKYQAAATAASLGEGAFNRLAGCYLAASNLSAGRRLDAPQTEPIIPSADWGPSPVNGRRPLATAPGTPTVSVVLPTYNRAHLLPRAIQSVLDQTWSDFELIVVDDGSSDDTPSVMASFTDPRIRYVRYELNQGANHARNVGIREARAEFIAFQDSDDDWFPDKLAKNMAAFETAGPEIGVVYSGYWKYIDAADHRIYIPLPWVKTRDGWIHDELLRNNFVTTQAAVVRRECFDRSGYWLEGLPGKQEWELFLRISRSYQFRYVDEPLLNSRFTPSGISNDRLGIYRSMERILELHHRDFAAHPAILAEHYVRLGLQYARAGEFDRGRDYLRRGAALQPSNWKYQAAAAAASLGEGAFNRLAGLYLAQDAAGT